MSSCPVDRVGARRRRGVGMTFSSELWDRGAAPVYDEIVRHPFITGLTDGSLDHDAFRYFIVQDSHYLRAYSRALTLVSARAVDEDAVSMFACMPRTRSRSSVSCTPPCSARSA